MQETPDPESRESHRIAEVFDELRASGTPYQEIFATVAEELKEMARKKTNRQGAGASLHATVLLNMTYMKLFGRQGSEFRWEDGKHFFLTVARAMHWVKVDYIRHKNREKEYPGKPVESVEVRSERGFDVQKQKPGPANKNVFEDKAILAYDMNKALGKLRVEFPEREEAIMLQEAGLTREESAEALGVSPDKVKRDLEQGKSRMMHYLCIERKALP
jgi:DNA-directed RNA polymerase specialized sigma24 family protein